MERWRADRWLTAILLAAIVFFAGADVLISTHFLSTDGVSYLDLADALAAHGWHALVNGYWSPGYPFALYLGRLVLDPSRANEYQAVHWIDAAILALLVACIWFFIRSLAPAADGGWTEPDQGNARLTRASLLALALAAVIEDLHGPLSIANVTPDVLVGCFVCLASGLLLRMIREPRMVTCALLGVTLGLGYLVKTVFLPVSVVVLACLLIFHVREKRRLLGAVVAAVLFVLVISPEIVALSRAKGHLDYGDSGRLNYLWLVDRVARQTPPLPGSPARALFTGLKHPPRVLSEAPRIEEFAQPVAGTMPLWDDPSYWYAGVKVPFSAPTQTFRIAASVVTLIGYFGKRPVLLGVLIAFLLACSISRETRHVLRSRWPVLLFAALFLVLYLMVEVEPRYIAVALMVLLLTILASLRFTSASQVKAAASFAVVAAAAIAIAIQSGRLRPDLVAAIKQGRTAILPNPYLETATALTGGMGLEPGDSIACVGAEACGDDYWARVARLRITAMVWYPKLGAHAMFEAGAPEEQRILDTLAKAGVKAAVVDLGHGSAAPAGWTRLGNSGRYAIRLPAAALSGAGREVGATGEVGTPAPQSR